MNEDALAKQLGELHHSIRELLGRESDTETALSVGLLSEACERHTAQLKRLNEIVIEGNGNPSLRSLIATVRHDVVELQAVIGTLNAQKVRNDEARKAYYVAIIAAVATVIASLLSLLRK